MTLQRHFDTRRELPIALAHCMTATKLGDLERNAMLTRMLLRLSPADKLTCQAELRACRQAKRGELLAVVS